MAIWFSSEIKQKNHLSSLSELCPRMVPSWAHIFPKHPGCQLWEQRFGNDLYLNTYEYLETVLKLQWYIEAIWPGDFRATFRLKVIKPCSPISFWCGWSANPAIRHGGGLSQMLEPDTQLNARVAIATQWGVADRKTCWHPRCPTVNLASLPETTPFCNSRSLTS